MSLLDWIVGAEAIGATAAAIVAIRSVKAVRARLRFHRNNARRWRKRYRRLHESREADLLSPPDSALTVQVAVPTRNNQAPADAGRRMSMADMIGASEAMASAARGKLRSEKSGGAMNTAFASYVAEGLTLPMRETLRRRQDDMFGPPVVAGAGVTLKALRRRGVIEGKVVPRVTELGELVITAAGLDAAGEAADGPR